MEVAYLIHYLNYIGHFYLCVQRKANAFLDVYGRFWKFQEVWQSCNMLRLIHILPSTYTNTMSVQWSYLHKNIIFLVIILIFQVLLRLTQKYLIPVINCLLCCMNWYSWGVIRSSHRIRTRSRCGIILH